MASRSHVGFQESFTSAAWLGFGLLGRPDLTSERFVADPFSSQTGARLYKTGDLVQRVPTAQSSSSTVSITR